MQEVIGSVAMVIKREKLQRVMRCWKPLSIIEKHIFLYRPIRYQVQLCFDEAADELEQRSETQEAMVLRTETVHWLWYNGISDGVKVRSREHIRDDAGHSSGAITDKYIDIESRERARSARLKSMS